jgi:CubicO group peptidase (beta-lactamase class C family)
VIAVPAIAATTRKSKPAPAAEQLLFPKSFREVIESGSANGAYAGVAVGVIDGKRNETLYFGHRDGPKSEPPDAESRFEIGAVSEVFTGLLLAQAAIDHTLKLQDPLGPLLAPGFPFADPAVGRATLADLATQRAGLPTHPANLFPTDLGDPYAGYATEDLLAFLALQPKGSDKASTPSYSVLNVGLLGNLLGRVYAAPLAEVLAARVLAPLGLTHTGFDDAQLLPGHVRGEPAPHWHYGVLGAAAGLRSTLPDLLEFMHRNLVPGDSALRGALLLARQARVAVDADQLGLGWKVREVSSGDATWPLIWRASGTAGFSAFIGFRTDKQRAIVLLGNSADDLADLGMAWLGETPPPSAPHGFVAQKRPDPGSYPGLYQLNSGAIVIVRPREGGLGVQLPGNWPQPLRAVDADVFASDSAALALTFIRNVDEITGLVLRLNNDNITAQRLSERAPLVARGRISVARSRLAEYVGDYRVGEDWLRVWAEEDRLVVQPTMGERLTLFGYAADRFSDAQNAVDLSGHRDRNGRLDRLVLDLAGTERDAVPLRPRAASPAP